MIELILKLVDTTIQKMCQAFFIRLRQNTLRLAAGMNGEVNRAEAHQSEGGLAMA